MQPDEPGPPRIAQVRFFDEHVIVEVWREEDVAWPTPTRPDFSLRRQVKHLIILTANQVMAHGTEAPEA